MTIKLRPYQTKAIQAVVHGFYKQGLSKGVVVLPTGGGKTFTASFLCSGIQKKMNVGILWIAHREELIKQAAEAFRTVAPGKRLTTWCADKIRLADKSEAISEAKDATGDVVLGMIMSCKKLPTQLKALHKATGRTWLVVIDECHHFAMPHQDEAKYTNEYIRTVGKIEKMGLIHRNLGLTATPERLDERPLAYDGNILYQIGFIDLVRQGYLARPIYYEMRTSENIGKLDVRGGDYTAKALTRLNTPRRNLAIADEYLSKKDQYGKALVFACDVQHARDLVQAFKKRDPNLDVRMISGSSDKAERKRIIKWLDSGPHTESKVLINCMIYTEGFDCKSLNTIMLARPTISRSLWMQMVGRGARVLSKFKPVPKDLISSAPAVGERGALVLKDGRETTLRVVREEEDSLVVQKEIKGSFHLVNITDNVTNYATLAHEWAMDIRTDEEAEDYKSEKKEKKKRKKRRRRAQETLDQLAEIQAGGLHEAKLVDVQGVLIFSTLWQGNIGVPLDQDRLDCIRRLNEYCASCWIKQNDPFTGEEETRFDQHTFSQSYSFCVPANEFPLVLWNKLAWAFYWHKIAGKRELRLKKKNPNNPHERVKTARTWRWIPFMDLRDPQIIQEARERIAKDMEVARAINAEFNTRYANKQMVHKLFTDCYNRAITNKNIRPATKAAMQKMLKRVTVIAARDRRLTIQTDINLSGQDDPRMGQMYKFRVALSEAMQAELNDSACSAICLTEQSSLKPKDGHDFALHGIRDKFHGDSKVGRQHRATYKRKSHRTKR